MLSLNIAMFNEVVNTGKPMVVDFWAPWCGPCRLLKPTLLDLETEYKDKVGFFLVDCDESPELASLVKISAIPTVLFLVGSQEKGRLVGVRSKNEIISEIENILS